MDKNILEETAKKMMTRPKGILAMDESSPTIAKRLASISTENNEINRRRYREVIVTAPNLSNYISGAILFEETFDQKMSDGTLFRDYLNTIGILPGIKVDKGAKDFSCHPNEKITEGLDGLRERLAALISVKTISLPPLPPNPLTFGLAALGHPPTSRPCKRRGTTVVSSRHDDAHINQDRRDVETFDVQIVRALVFTIVPSSTRRA